MGRPAENILERFNKKYIPVTESGCWIWTASCRNNTYGQFRMSRNPNEALHSAHRASWILHRGPIPDGMNVCHACDVTCCVNPDHLFLGTDKDNMQDASRKGRMNWKNGEKRNLPVGENHSQAKLQPDHVREIRSSSLSCSILAAMYGVTNITISRIKRRTIWRHLN